MFDKPTYDKMMSPQGVLTKVPTDAIELLVNSSSEELLPFAYTFQPNSGPLAEYNAAVTRAVINSLHIMHDIGKGDWYVGMEGRVGSHIVAGVALEWVSNPECYHLTRNGAQLTRALGFPVLNSAIADSPTGNYLIEHGTRAPKRSVTPYDSVLPKFSPAW